VSGLGEGGGREGGTEGRGEKMDAHAVICYFFVVGRGKND